MSTAAKPARRKGLLHEEKSAQTPPLSGDAEIPEYCGEAAVKIIAVHGLASKYERTWSVELEDGSRYHWLQEKLGADIPQARILGYEYGSEWYGDPAYTNLEECGSELLRCIIRDRCHLGRPEMCPTRRRCPVIFIAHSFGGLVVKQAIVIAYRIWRDSDNADSPVREAVRRAQAANYRDFLCSIAGIIFLGTPHRGSVFSSWAKLQMAFGFLGGRRSHPELVKVLGANSEPLRELQRAFEDACRDSTVLDILPRCYRETRQIALPPYIVVDRESAWLDPDYAKNGALDADHMQMNKFHPGTDANYNKVLSDVQEIFWSEAKSVPRRLEKWRYGSLIAEDDRKMVARRLAPSEAPQIQRFQSKLASQQAAPYTCRWLEQQAHFRDWDSGSGGRNVLWIHGKPASGKSVLAAYVINALGSSTETATYSPCRDSLRRHACGSKLTKSTVLYYFGGTDQSHDKPEGLLGTLIHQLLTIHDTDEMMFAAAYRWKETTPVTKVNGMTLANLLLELLGRVTGPVFIVIDGLDEIPRSTECLRYLHTITSSAWANTRLLVLSQRQEDLRLGLLKQHPAAVSLDITNYSQLDISQYIAQKTEQLLDRKPSFKPKSDDIIRKLQDEADGMFELINVAVHDLEHHVAHVDEVNSYLANLPGSLQDVYNKIFARLNPTNSDVTRARIKTALQFLAVSAVPITIFDLYTALGLSSSIRDGGRKEELRKYWALKRSPSHDADLKRHLISLLDTLIEIDSNHCVSLVHSSLRRMLLQSQASSGNWNASRSIAGPWYKFSADEAHLVVSEICIFACGGTTLMRANDFSIAQPPLVAYAWTFWAHHLRESKFTLGTQASRSDFDRMLGHVHRDTLYFLAAVGGFVTKPLEPVPGKFTLLEYRQSLQKAQDSLALAIDALCRARQSIPVSAKLCEARAGVPDYPYQLEDISLESRYQRGVKWIKQAASRVRNWLFKDQTQVVRVKLDDLMEQPGTSNMFDHGSYPDSVAALLNASRSLRSVALRFSVNPLHAALIQKAGSSDFSPINLLVYVAQLLEEAASFPYWQHLPEMLDPTEAFLSSAADPQSEPAKFVLQSVNRQRLNKCLAAELETSGQLGRIGDTASGELSRQLQQLNEATAHHWIAARYAFYIFRPDGDSGGWFQTLVANPMSNLYLRDKLFMLRSGEGQMPVFLSPEATLDLRAPTILRDGPVKEMVMALPAMLKLAYAKYIMTLLEMFAEVPRAGIVAHFIQLTTSKTELLECALYAKRVVTFSLLRWGHVLFALLLYLLRCKFLPWFGAHAMAHPWATLLLSYKHPAAYLNLQSLHDGKFWFKYSINVRIYRAIGRTFVNFSRSDSIQDQPILLFFSDAVVSLHYVINLERNLFGLGFAFAVLTASSKVILYVPENLAAAGRFTFVYVLANGVAMFNLFAGAMLQQNRATFLQGLPVVLFELVVVTSLVMYQATALRVLIVLASWILWPITGPAMAMWNLGLYLYAPVLKFCGVLVFICIVLLAVFWVEKAVFDPHDLEGSRRAVTRALEKLASVYPQTNLLVIGKAPLWAQVPAEVTGERDADRASSRRDPWAWPEDFCENETAPTDLDPTNDTNPPSRAAQARNAGDIEQHIESTPGTFWESASSEFGKAFEPVRQSIQNTTVDFSKLGFVSGIGGVDFGSESRTYSSISSTIRNRHFRYPAGNSFIRNDDVNYASYRDQRGNGWHFGAERPGGPFTTLSYTHTSMGPMQWRELALVGTWFMIWLAMIVYYVWGWWMGWFKLVSVELKPKCWHIGLPLGPIYFGYGCEGWFWEVLAGDYD